MLRASAIWALLTGVTLAVMEIRANWGDWQWWPWWVVDFAAAAMLIAGGTSVLRKKAQGPALLCAGWAFTFGMAWMSLAGNIAAGPDPDRDARLAGVYIFLVGSLVASSAIGLGMVLTAIYRK